MRKSLCMLSLLVGFGLSAPAAQADIPASKYWKVVKKKFGIEPGAKKSGKKAGVLFAGSTPVGLEGFPEGTDKRFVWDRQETVLLVAFVNAADSTGVVIEGVQQNDTVTVTAATGIASFDDGTAGKSVSSFLGLAATGAKAETKNELAGKAIDELEKAANQLLATDSLGKKRRDPYGADPSSGHQARQEGGILVCLPEALGTYSSGGFWDRDRWIKKGGHRSDSKRPKHVKGAFFLVRKANANVRTAGASGPMFIVPWDHKFSDNEGFYKVFVRLEKGDSNPPVVLKKSETSKRPKIRDRRGSRASRGSRRR